MKSFEEISLKDQIRKSLTDLNFLKPTETQGSVIPQLIDGSDVITVAETGSGKTAAYAIPMVEKLLSDTQEHALVLAPTRELAQQISEFLRELTTYCDGLRVLSIVGGADMRKQLNALKKNPRIIVATPGRLMDHLRRKSMNLKNTSTLVLDEGDRMLDMGFAPQLDEILKYVPQKRQTSLFTATMSESVRSLANKYLHQPKQIKVGRASMPVAAIHQSVVQVQADKKSDLVVDELINRDGSVIIFAKTKRRTTALAKHLESYGFGVDQIHGGRSQGQRNLAIRNFKAGKSRILCATDVAARGIDVPQVEHVVNFDLPMFAEDYVHRIGRTARNGRSGEAVSFVTPEDHQMWNKLVRKYQIKDVEILDVVRGRKEKGMRHSKSSGGGKFSRKRKPARFGGRRSDDDFAQPERPKFKAKSGSDWYSGGDGESQSRDRKPSRFGEKFSDERSQRQKFKGKKKFSRSSERGSDDRFESAERSERSSFKGKKKSSRFADRDLKNSKSSEERSFKGKKTSKKRFTKKRADESGERSDRPKFKGKKKSFKSSGKFAGKKKRSTGSKKSGFKKRR